MYKLHLIWKYLRKRRIAWVSLIAVTLCTAMVLVVISVMGGWLRMFRTSFHGLSGDIVVTNGSLSGFAYYPEMIAEIERIPEVAGAAPVIETFGLININARKTTGVRVLGYPMDRIGGVNKFQESLWRQYNQWRGWLDGAPVTPEDRKRLIENEHVAVRPAGDLLRLTEDERRRLKDFLPKAQAAAEKLKVKAVPEDDETKARVRTAVYYAEKGIAEVLKDPNWDRLTPWERESIREYLGKLVDDPDERLRANEDERKLILAYGEALGRRPSFDKFYPPKHYSDVYRERNPKAKQQIVDEAANFDGVIVGAGVAQIHKNRLGKTEGRVDDLYGMPVSMTVIGVPPNGSFDLSNKAERNYWIVDTSQTKVWQYDSDTVYVPFETVQRDLGMEAQARDEDGKSVTTPPRTTHIYIKAKPGFSDGGQPLKAVANKVQEAIDGVLRAKQAAGQSFTSAAPVARTWEETQYKWLGAIEKEKTLVTGLFGLISVVAIFLIFCIFYMIVAEKTRDIGIIKSVGATSTGVAGIFLGYGAVIGLVGAGAGFLIGFLVVRNINTLHDWLGRALGVQVWDPEVYAFDTIPNTMDAKEVVVILSVAVISSVLGALVPAIRAARMNPVEALRWE